MNIIGVFSEESEAKEFENIAKVFLVEERVKHITPKQQIELVEKNKINCTDKSSISESLQSTYLSKFTVKGLN